MIEEVDELEIAKKISDTFTKDFFPNTFIIGAPKCGTTSVYRYLKQSNQVFAPNVKEPSVLADLPNIESKLQWYYSLYEGGKYQIRLDSTSIHLYGSDVLPSILNNLHNETKIIVLLRDPVDRFLSFFGFLKHMNVLDLDTDIIQFVSNVQGDLDKDPFLTNWDYHIDGNRYYASTLLGGCYFEHLYKWQVEFGDRMRIYFFDDLANRPNELMGDLSDFLGITNIWKDTSLKVENKTIKPRVESVHKILVWMYGKVGGVINRFERFKRSLLDIYISMNNSQKDHRYPMDALDALRRYYKQDLIKTRIWLEEKSNYYGTLPEWLSVK